MVVSRDRMLPVHEKSPTTLYRKAEKLIEGDGAAGHIIVSIIVGGTTALSGVVSVAGLATALAEREFLFTAAAVVGTLVGGVWKIAAGGPPGALGEAINAIRRETKSAYRDGIDNAGLTSTKVKRV